MTDIERNLEKCGLLAPVAARAQKRGITVDALMHYIAMGGSIYQHMLEGVEVTTENIERLWETQEPLFRADPKGYFVKEDVCD